jgi:hypothetical protein
MAIVSDQVKILLERMDLYPEEFVRPFESRRLQTKWNEVLQEGHFNQIEKFLIKRKYVKLKRKATQEMIMQTIMDDSSPQDFSFDTVSRAAKTLMNTPRMRMKQE